MTACFDYNPPVPWLALLLLADWEEIHVEAILRKDGAVEVRQVLYWNGPAETLRIGIDRAGIDRIEAIALEPGTHTVREEMRATWVEWSAPGPGRWTLSYVVWGTVQRIEGGIGLDWRALSEFRSVPVRKLWVRLRLPRAVREPEIVVHVESACRTSELWIREDTVGYEGEGLYARESVVVRARLPEGIVDAPVLVRRELKLRYGSILLFALPGGCLLVLLTIYLLRGRDPRVAASAGPARLPPALAGLVIDEVAGAPEATAAAADLLRRGALRAEGDALVLGSASGLAPYEARVVEALFGRDARADAAGPPPKGAPNASAVADAIYEEGMARGFFRRSPEKERLAYRAAGIALAAAGIAFALATWKHQTFYIASLLLLGLPLTLIAVSFAFERARLTVAWLATGLALLAVGLVLLAPTLDRVGFNWQTKVAAAITLCGPIFAAFAPAMPVKTLAGAEAKENAARLLRALEAAPPEAFEEWLPYAVAFRLKKPFVYRAAAAGARTPSWWTPAGAPLAEHADALLRLLGAVSARFGRDLNVLGGG